MSLFDDRLLTKTQMVEQEIYAIGCVKCDWVSNYNAQVRDTRYEFMEHCVDVHKAKRLKDMTEKEKEIMRDRVFIAELLRGEL